VAAPLWTIVLAAGAGRRLNSVTGGVPKQFWSADGGPSFLEQTVDRVAGLIPASRTVTVVDRTHREFVNALAEVPRLGQIVYQPCDRGTAAGVLLGLATVVAAAPDAIVVITPSDHGEARPETFADGVRRAVARVESGRNEIVLFGVTPSTALADYGWITPAARGAAALQSDDAGALLPVAAFIEKPPVDEAARLMASGALWNTMVLAARASALMDLYRRHLPALTGVFLEALRRPAADRAAFLAERYAQLPSADFSRDLLMRAHGLAVFVWPADIGWSDLGTPDRLAAWSSGDRRPRPAESAPAAPMSLLPAPRVA
jgi:mannose-1-phosphate guanylyltransferase